MPTAANPQARNRAFVAHLAAKKSAAAQSAAADGTSRTSQGHPFANGAPGANANEAAIPNAGGKSAAPASAPIRRPSLKGKPAASTPTRQPSTPHAPARGASKGGLSDGSKPRVAPSAARAPPAAPKPAYSKAPPEGRPAAPAAARLVDSAATRKSAVAAPQAQRAVPEPSQQPVRMTVQLPASLSTSVPLRSPESGREQSDLLSSDGTGPLDRVGRRAITPFEDEVEGMQDCSTSPAFGVVPVLDLPAMQPHHVDPAHLAEPRDEQLTFSSHADPSTRDDLGVNNYLAEAGTLVSETDRRGPVTPRIGGSTSPHLGSTLRSSVEEPSLFPGRVSGSSPRSSVGRSPAADFSVTPTSDGIVAGRSGSVGSQGKGARSITVDTLRRINLASGGDGVGKPRLAATTPRMGQASHGASAECSFQSSMDDIFSISNMQKLTNGAVTEDPPNGSFSVAAARKITTTTRTVAAQSGAGTASHATQSTEPAMKDDSRTYIDAVAQSMRALYVPCLSPQDIGQLPYVSATSPAHICLRSMSVTTSMVASLLSYGNRYPVVDLLFEDCAFTLYDYTWLRRLSELKTIRLKGKTVSTKQIAQILHHATQIQNLTLYECSPVASLEQLASSTCQVRSIQLISTEFSQRALSDIVNCPSIEEVMLLNVGLHANIFELFNSNHISAVQLVDCRDFYYAEKDEKEWLSKCSPRAGAAPKGAAGGAKLTTRSLLLTDLESLALEKLPWAEFGCLEELSIMHKDQLPLPVASLHDVFRKGNLRLLRLQHVFVDEYLVQQIQLCPELEELNLSYCKGFQGIEELWPSLRLLKRLNLSFSEIQSSQLQSLHTCIELQQVFAQGCPYITDFGTFRMLPSLNMLDLSNCRSLDDIGFDGQYECHKLQCLVLSGCERLRHIPGLRAITTLEVARLNFTHLSDDSIVALLTASCNTLAELDLSQCDSLFDLTAVPFARCEALSYVNLSGTQVLDATVAALGLSPHLRHADLSFCEYVTSVATLGALSDLSELDLSFSAITDDGLAQYTAHPQCKYLRKLILRGCTGVRDLSCLGKLKRLRELNLSESSVDGALTLPSLVAGCEVLEAISVQGCPAVRDIGAIGKARSLRRVDASLTDVADGCLGALAACRTLEELSLSGCSSLRNVSPLSELQLLQRLNLSNTSVDVSSMAGLFNCRNLWDLSLAAVKDLKDISVLSPIASLQRLDVSCTEIGDVSFSVPWRCPLLEELDLSSCTCLASFAPSTLRELKCLRRLSLAGTAVTDAALKAVASCAALEELVLNGCQGLSNAGVLASLRNLCSLQAAGTPLIDASFVDFYRCKRLTDIDLSSCPNVHNLSALARCESLRTLVLQGSGVTDETFTANSSPGWTSSALISLDLSDCANIRDIPAISDLPELKSLDLSRSAVADAGVAHIAQCRSLRKLALVECAELSSAAPLGTMSALKVLDLSGSAVAALTADSSAAPWSTQELLRVSFRGCKQLRDVSALHTLNSLTVLDMSDSGCSDESFAGVSWSASSCLQNLLLQGCTHVTDLRGLKDMRHLTTLALANSTVNSASIDALRECSSLETVDLRGCSQAANVQALSKLPRLRCLLLASSGVSSESFAESWTCPSLLEMDCSNCQNLEDLVGVSSLPALRKLSLANTWANDATVRSVSKIVTLEELDVSGCTGVRTATSLGRAVSVRVLNLSGSLVDNTTLIGLPMCRTIEELDMRNCNNITDAFLAHDFGRLRTLYMPPLDNVVGAFIKHCPCLERLTVPACPPTSHATWFEHTPFLRVLDLRGSKLSHEFFSALSRCPLLQELNLSGCSGVVSVEALRQLKHLKALDLSRTAVDDAVCADLSLCQGLQVLDLSRCKNVESISSLQTLQRIRLLNLSGTSVDDTAMAVARQMPGLQVLLLGYCKHINDCSALKGAPRLTTLDFSHSSLSIVDEQKLRATCPVLQTVRLSGCDVRTWTGMMGAARSAFGGFFKSYHTSKSS